jgi:hypothetical protein
VNLQDALAIAQARLGENTETVHILGVIKHAAEAWAGMMVESFGSDSDVAKAFDRLGDQTEAAQAIAAALAVELETLIEEMQAIE